MLVVALQPHTSGKSAPDMYTQEGFNDVVVLTNAQRQPQASILKHLCGAGGCTCKAQAGMGWGWGPQCNLHKPDNRGNPGVACMHDQAKGMQTACAALSHHLKQRHPAVAALCKSGGSNYVPCVVVRLSTTQQTQAFVNVPAALHSVSPQPR